MNSNKKGWCPLHILQKSSAKSNSYVQIPAVRSLGFRENLIPDVLIIYTVPAHVKSYVLQIYPPASCTPLKNICCEIIPEVCCRNLKVNNSNRIGL